MIIFESRGDFKKTEKFFKAMLKGKLFDEMDKYGRMGVDALASYTPRDTGLTAADWGYEISRSFGSYSITWTNRNPAGGTPVVILLQYGHGTGTGGYVQGQDFINPALRPVFDAIAEGVWKAVTTA